MLAVVIAVGFIGGFFVSKVNAADPCKYRVIFSSDSGETTNPIDFSSRAKALKAYADGGYSSMHGGPC